VCCKVYGDGRGVSPRFNFSCFFKGHKIIFCDMINILTYVKADYTLKHRLMGGYYMKCPYCQTENAEDSEYCGKCRRSLRTKLVCTSPWNSRFSLQLSLSYGSGSDNGPFGFIWRIPLTAITWKTDKWLPQRQDTEDLDAFILSRAENLASVLQPNCIRFRDNRTTLGYIIHHSNFLWRDRE
jgi:hypothetical protein